MNQMQKPATATVGLNAVSSGVLKTTSSPGSPIHVQPLTDLFVPLESVQPSNIFSFICCNWSSAQHLKSVLVRHKQCSRIQTVCCLKLWLILKINKSAVQQVFFCNN